MKTLVAVILSLAGGVVLGVAAVAGIQAAVNPDHVAETSQQSQIDVLPYGNR